MLSFVSTGQLTKHGRPNYLKEGRKLSWICYVRKVLSIDRPEAAMPGVFRIGSVLGLTGPI